MKALINMLDLRAHFRGEDLKPTVILIIASLMPAIHRYFGSMEFAARSFARTASFEAAAFMFGAAFFLLAVIPLAVIVLVFHEPLKNYGLQLGNWKAGFMATALLFPLIAGAMLYPASQTAEMRAVYPFDMDAGASWMAFLQFECMRGALFYTAWEFFFRGFMLFGLRKHVGDWLAICIQTIPSCLWHIGMPTGEIISSIAGGILFGLLAIRTRSILWPFLLHVLIGAGLDFFIVIT